MNIMCIKTTLKNGKHLYVCCKLAKYKRSNQYDSVAVSILIFFVLHCEEVKASRLGLNRVSFGKLLHYFAENMWDTIMVTHTFEDKQI